MYLYTIPQTPNKNANKLLSKRTKLNRRHATKLKANKTKKLSREELDGGFLGLGCLFGCKMPKEIYKSTKQLVLPELTKALAIPTNDTKYKDIIEDGIESGFLRQFLHGIYAKLNNDKRKKLESVYLEYIKKYIKLLMMSANPTIFTNQFPTSYYKIDTNGKFLNSMDYAKDSGAIEISSNIITPDNLAVHIDNILKADKQNLQNYESYKNKRSSPKKITELNKFIFDTSVVIPPDKKHNFNINKVLYFYNPSQCVINEKGNIQQRDACNVIFTFCTKNSQIFDRELSKSDFAMVETNFKMIRAYSLLITNLQNDKHKFNSYKNKIIALLTDTYKIKSYIDGCIKFFSYMEKFNTAQGEKAGLNNPEKTTQ